MSEHQAEFDQFVVTELALVLPHPPPEDEPHPERTPVGPFPSREAADLWAESFVAKFGGTGSWSVSPVYPPARCES